MMSIDYNVLNRATEQLFNADVRGVLLDEGLADEEGADAAVLKR